MKQSKLCKICACIRHDFECDGYTLFDKDSYDSKRVWYYRHTNGNRIIIVLDLEEIKLRVLKNSIVIKEIF